MNCQTKNSEKFPFGSQRTVRKQERELNKISKTMSEQEQKFDKEIETIKQNEIEILDYKIIKTEQKNSVKSCKNRFHHAKELVT